MSSKPPDLVRGFGIWSSTAIVVGGIIGAGIFLVPSQMARATGSVKLVLAAWIVGGALSLFGAVSYAELSSALPEAGGDYAFLKRGFGSVWGFLFGWTTATVLAPVGIATLTAAILRFVSFLLPAVAAPLFSWQISQPFQEEAYEFRFTLAQPLAVLAIFIVTAANSIGIRSSGRIQVILTGIKVISILAIVALGLGLSVGPVDRVPADSLQPSAIQAFTLSGFLTAVAAALFAYNGWSFVTHVGSEVANPQKNISRAIVGGFLLVGALYILTNLTYFSVLSLPAVAQSQSVASDVVVKFAGPGAAQWITVAMVISVLGSLNAGTLAQARIPFALARDNLFFSFASRIHHTFRMPVHALWFQASLGSLFVLTGTFEELLFLRIFAVWIFYGLTVLALFRLRLREPDLERPYRAWGYPWSQALFVAGALALTANLWFQFPYRCSIGLLLILSGLPFYRHWRKQTNPSQQCLERGPRSAGVSPAPSPPERRL